VCGHMPFDWVTSKLPGIPKVKKAFNSYLGMLDFLCSQIEENKGKLLDSDAYAEKAGEWKANLAAAEDTYFKLDLKGIGNAVSHLGK